MYIFLNVLILLSILYVYMYIYDNCRKKVTNLREQVSALMGQFEGRRGKGKLCNYIVISKTIIITLYFTIV